MIDTVNHSAPCAAWLQVHGDAVLEISGDLKRDGPSGTVTGTAPTCFPTRYQTEKLGTDDSPPAFNDDAHTHRIRPSITTTPPSHSSSSECDE
jgi:hypothetical protein